MRKGTKTGTKGAPPRAAWKSCGKRVEYAGASCADSDSVDLAEVEYGNGTEIARRYAGASFANSDSADLAEIANGNAMEILRRYAGASFANSMYIVVLLLML